jgi:PAS domain-containing protein
MPAAATPALHLCIATGQNLANLIPALQCGAQEVWILQTREMHARAGFLADALKARGIAVHRIDFADDDVRTLHEQAAGVAERLDGRAVTVNITGGTKLMTLALTDTLAPHLATGEASTQPHVVYTDTRHRRLDWLRPEARTEPMADVLTIDDMLLAQGYRRQAGSGGAEAAEWQRAADERKALTRRLGEQAERLARFFGALNTLAQSALGEPGGPWRPEQDFEFTPGGANAELLRAARSAGLLAWDEQTHVVFRDRDAARYLGGGWVEEFAGLKVSGELRGRWAARVRIESVDGRTPNELDLVAVHANRMLVVECKAAAARDNDVADWIYKASRLALQVGGQMARPLLLSARQIGEAHRQRAREYGVDILAAGELASLPAYLRRWMAG